MRRYRKRLYTFAGNIDDDEDYNDDIVIPEYRSVSDTTSEVIRPVLLNQQAVQYLSNKTIEKEKDRVYAYRQPFINNQVAVRPTPAREEAIRKQVEEQTIADNYARYVSSLPAYMITDRPGLERPMIGLEDILFFGGKSLLEKGAKSLYNLATRETPLKIAGNGYKKLATNKTGEILAKVTNKTDIPLPATTDKTGEALAKATSKTNKSKTNKYVEDTPEYNYNIAEYPVMKTEADKVEKATSFLYNHPRNRLQIDINMLKRSGWKMDGDKLAPKSVNADIDKNINTLITDLNTEYRRAINWNKSRYRIWDDEKKRKLYIKNLKKTKSDSTINITDLSKIGYHGYYTNPTHNIFLDYQNRPALLNTYYHELSHAGDMFDNLNPIKSALLVDFRANYIKPISQGARRYASNTGKERIPIRLQEDTDNLLKNYYNGRLTNPDLIRKAHDLETYTLTNREIVARVEELRQDLLTKAIQLNGKPFSPRTIIGNKEFEILNNPKSQFGHIEKGVEKSILQKHNLDMFTPKTLMDLMNKLPFAAGIGTAGLAGYGLSED
jgi:hypothetical protein